MYSNIFVIFLFAFVSLFSLSTFAETLDSDSGSYKIVGLNFNSESEDANSNSGTYSVYISAGDAVNDDRFESSSYSMGAGTSEIFMAGVSNIDCFETSTNGSTNCANSDILSVPIGVEKYCGNGACYNKARFEIVPSSENPADARYLAQVSEDSGFGTYMIVDGVTKTLKDSSLKTINDYLTESEWEDVVDPLNYDDFFNLKGLDPGTTYFVRVVALNGDFTESGPGPALSATTGYPSITFDLDIDVSDGIESSAPYSLSLGELFPDVVETATDKIWLDFATNLDSGVVVYINDLNDGLLGEAAQLIPSPSLEESTSDFSDLSSVANTEGFGIRLGDVSESFGSVSLHSFFSQSGADVVGKVESTNLREILNTGGGAILSGGAGVSVKAKASSATVAGSFSDTLTFTVLADI